MYEIHDDITKKIHKVLSDNKAKEITKINLKKKSSIADFMIICSGTSNRHVISLSNYLVQALKKENLKIYELAKDAIFVPENTTADKALRLLLAQHCQLSMVVDEFGSVVGVLAMEDIIENILGKEIFEHDDPAVDMRELAKQKHHFQSLKDGNL